MTVRVDVTAGASLLEVLVWMSLGWAVGITVGALGMKVDLRRDGAGKQDGSADERGRELHRVGNEVLKVGDV